MDPTWNFPREKKKRCSGVDFMNNTVIPKRCHLKQEERF